MSTVPPSPPCADHADVLATLAFSAAAIPVATAARWRTASGSRASATRTPGTASRTPPGSRSRWRRSCGPRWPASRRRAHSARRAPRRSPGRRGGPGDRVRAVLVGLDRALLGVEQAVADREAARLVVADRRRAHAHHAPTPSLRRDDAERRAGCSPRAARTRARRACAPARGSTSVQSRSRNVSGCSSSATASVEQVRNEALVIGRPRDRRPPCSRAAAMPSSAHAHVGRDDPADADRKRLLQHEHSLGVAKRSAHRLAAGTGETR